MNSASPDPFVAVTEQWLDRVFSAVQGLIHEARALDDDFESHCLGSSLVSLGVSMMVLSSGHSRTVNTLEKLIDKMEDGAVH